jgi:hypothetical protein
MNRPSLSGPLRSVVRERAGGFCEYCRMPDLSAFFAHEPDHIIAAQHGGQSNPENLALACIQCNRFKGPNIPSVDPETKRIVPLFNPRTDQWPEHFRAKAGRIIPLTPIARATAALLNFNDPDREEVRRSLWEAGRYPG